LTTEAELIALSETTKEAIAVKRFFHELTLDLESLWNVWCDNQQTIRLIIGKTERITTRLRHVDIQNMWLKQEHLKGEIEIKYLDTANMPADGLTKNLTKQQFDCFKTLINVHNAKAQIKEAKA